tara:strand:- start:20331 stop:21704 length:1374 start_codon:yes stop_codon:yes gene_type:complete
MKGFEFLENYGNNICLYKSEDEKLTYRQVAEKSDRIVSNLPVKSLFALDFYPTISCITAYLGALRNNHVVLLVDPLLDESLKNRILDNFNITILFNGQEWLNRKVIDKVSYQINPDLSILLSTSGSTGSPKLVKLSKKNLTANANSIVSYMKLSSSDRAISSLPLHYSYGLSILNSHLNIGASFYLTESPVTSQVFWKFFKENNITGLAGVPTTWRILRKLYFERMKLPSLRLVTQAGGKLSKEEVIWLSNIGNANKYKVFIMYGQTEATARISYLEPKMTIEKAGSIGKAIPGGELYLENEREEVITASNLEGELIYKGDNVMMGYALMASDLSKGSNLKELKTGDLAKRDEDGFYWITGRKKRFIKLYGNRISLDDVEEFIQNRDIESSVFGIDDNLYVAILKKDNINIEDLRDEISKFYSIHFSTITIIKIESIPKSSSGKILYKELENLIKIT